jgi:cobalt-zinc-cadmium efflux system protein
MTDGRGHEASQAHHDRHEHAHDHHHAHGKAAHAHGAEPGHAHAHAPANFDRAFAIGIGLNLAFVAVEAFYGWRANSLALLADAGHNLSDVAGLLLAWAAVWAGRRRPDARHTYGFKRATILAAFANAVLLLVAMGSLTWEAVLRLRAPEPSQAGAVMVVAAIGIVVNGVTALLFLRGRHDLNLRGAFWHMAGDALVSAGVVLAGALTLFFGWQWLDPAVSLLIAVVIVAGTWGLLRQSLHLLFDGVPSHIELDAVRARLAALPGVSQVHDLHVWAMGTTEVALTAHLVMPGGAPGDAFLRDAAAEMKTHFAIGHVTLQTVQAPVMTACGETGADAGPMPLRRADAGA